MKYSGKVISQSEVPKSTNVEDMHTRLASNNAAYRKEENNSRIKAF